MIPSVAWVDAYILRQTRFRHIWKGFLTTKVTELVNKLIIDPIIEEMKLNGVSEKIYQNVVVNSVAVTNSGIFINIHSEYFAENGFDVALAREKGTDDHWVRPRNSEHSLVWIQNGKKMGSKGHKVSGLPRLNIIERMVEEGEYELQQAINTEFKKWKSSIMV